MSNAITAYVEQINSGTSLRLKVKRSNRQIVVLGLAGRSLSVDWEFESSNNLDGFELDVSLWDRHPPMPGLPHFEKPNRLKQISFDFDLLPTERTGWIPTHDRKRAFSTEDLADHLLKFYMDSGQ